MKILNTVALALVVVLASILSAGAARQTQADKDAKEVAEAIELFKKSDKALAKWFDSAYGYVVFPNIAKGAVGVGAPLVLVIRPLGF